MALLAEVILPLPLEQTYTYVIPEALEPYALPGCRVLVPFGSRRLTGLIAEARGCDHETDGLRAIEDVLDEEPSLTAELLRLTKWISAYYVCGWGEAVKAALPTGTDVEGDYVVRLVSHGANGEADKLTQRILRYVSRHEQVALSTLRKEVRGATLPLLRRIEGRGLVMLEEETERARVKVKREKHVRLAPAYGSPEAKEGVKGQLKGAKQTALVELLFDLATEGALEFRQADLLARAGAGASTLHSLESRGIIEVVERE
ncbi:MAG TPA: primosomal protein N', partial [Rhodothermales bacterium]|nr:primosomal protein N' [Rhodothermales bacterium]